MRISAVKNQSYSTDEDIAYLKNEGYLVDLKLEDIVRSIFDKYGGSKIIFNHQCVDDAKDWIRIWGQKASNTIDSGWVIEEYSDRVGTELCIIGEAWRSHMVLCVDKHENIYAAYDNHMIKVGNTFDEAMNNIISGKIEFDVIQ